VAEEQRKWQQAEEYYQKALQINIDCRDRYELATNYHQLGRTAQEQRKWQQAEEYYDLSQQIFIDFNDHYGQANNHHQLGMVARERRCHHGRPQTEKLKYLLPLSCRRAIPQILLHQGGRDLFGKPFKLKCLYNPLWRSDLVKNAMKSECDWN
jgi:tetratricopeptide (TPR) repeat protein